jgi:hypothetical protein
MRNVQQSLMVVVAVCITLGYWIVDTRLRRAKGIRVPKRCPTSTPGPEHGEGEFGGDGRGPRALVDSTSPEWARRSFLDESEMAPGPKSATSITAEPGKSQRTSASDITPANELEAEIEKLRAENEALKSGRHIHFKVSDKGALSVYGIWHFPVTLYREQWERLLIMAPQIKTFLSEHQSELKIKIQQG